MKKPLKIGFVDFYCNWGPWPNPIEYFSSVLSLEYEVEVVVSDFRGHRFDTHKKPDLVFCTIPAGEQESTAPGGASTIEPLASSAIVDAFAGSSGSTWPGTANHVATTE